ncbi:hypothetical protein HPB48_001674 [Haemaphysalis longicornis]|uniref:CCHC-type domain-containing protein n=1 Tax=Haemaphysalis longicornis TaxID=44386 RepID=A0A9J6GTJ7_HAELO|nr:hypothetical protein HPB48_001674 [Haemaphysalis longicornis]
MQSPEGGMTQEEEEEMQDETPETVHQGENNAVKVSFDADSGRTVYQTLWMKEVHRRSAAKKKKEEEGKSETAAGINSLSKVASNPSTSIGKPPRRTGKSTGNRSPPLPETDYKIVFRPTPGLHLAKWKDSDAALAMARAVDMPLRDFVNKVTTQVQWAQNLLVASTAHEDMIDRLTAIRQLQVGPNLCTFTAYLKPLPNTSAGVVVGITDWLTNDNIMDYISAERHEIVSARRLGNSSAAIIHFEGPHVPFYIKVLGTIARCRPYRKSVQYCKACGDIGHRQDVCPSPKPEVCSKCGKKPENEEHNCNPTCKLCNLPHETAGKECRRRLKPPPPPLRTRQAWDQTSGKAAWSTAPSETNCNSFRPKNAMAATGVPSGILKESSSESSPSTNSRSRSHSRSSQRIRKESRSPSRSLSRRAQGDVHKVVFSEEHFPPLAQVSCPSSTCTSKEGRDAPDWAAAFEALRRNAEENTRITKELMKEHALTRSYMEEMLKEIKQMKLHQAGQDKEVNQMKQDQGTFQQMAIQTFEQIQAQIQNINTTLKENLETQRKIQDTLATLINGKTELDRRVTTIEEKDKARKKPKSYPGREARMEETLDDDDV